MAGEAEKRTRTISKRKFTRTLNRLNEALLKEEETDVIESQFKQLKILWEDVQSKHDAYVFAIYPDVEEPDDKDQEEWLSILEEKFELIQRERNQYKKHLKEERDIADQSTIDERLLSESMESVNISKERRELQKMMFVEEVKTVEKSIKDDGDGYLQSYVVTGTRDVKHQLEKCKEAHSVYTGLLGAEQAGRESVWIKDIYTLYREFNGDVQRYYERVANAEIRRKKNISVQLERIKMPSFNGNIRSYAKFKTDFKAQVETQVESKESLVYILKSCMIGDPLDAVENLDEASKIWERLDEKYGRPSLLVDVIINEIRNIRSIRDGNYKDFIHLVEVIERGYSDLCRLNIGKEMSNSLTVSMIEERLPSDIKRDWSKEVNRSKSEVDAFDKFPAFMKFLLEQKRVLEYEMASLRSSIATDKASLVHFGAEDKDKGLPYRKGIKRCLIHNHSTHSTNECPEYLRKTPQEKVQLIKEKRACWSCLKFGHRSADCWIKVACGIDNCMRFHHQSLHEAHILGISFHTFTLNFSDYGHASDSCLLQLMPIHSGKIELSVLWDSGASISLITFRKAQELKLHGNQVKLSIVKIGGDVDTITSYVYKLPLIDKHNSIVFITVYGITSISQSIQHVDIGKVVHKFKGLKLDDVKRPNGEVDVLIGYNYASLHPVKEKSVGNLLLMHNRFGRCLAGSNETVKERNELSFHTVHVHFFREADFLNIESIGIQSTPSCGDCKCGKCSLGSKGMTIQEEREQRLIKEGLRYMGGYWIATYPWKRDPSHLPNNKIAALRMLESTERRLLKNKDHAEVYKEQIKDMLDRDVARILLEKEIDDYKGPVYYLSHHEVLKKDVSTPCRIVFNSSCRFMNHILNEYWAKGPNLLNSLLGILMRFRENKVAIQGDIKKMYHTIKISILDQHTHRFLWRNLETERKPDTYIMTSVSFGDKPAGNIAITALHETAKMGKELFPEAADVIVKNTYVDDILDSFDTLSKARSITFEIDKLIAVGGFKVKEWTFSKINCEEEIDVKDLSPHNQNVLGLIWDQIADVFRYKLKLNFSLKKRGIHCSSDLKREDIPSKIPAVITKRMVLSQINSIYDPLGLISPFTVVAKFLLKELWKKNLDWDEYIGDSNREQVIQFFTDAFELEDISFKRCLKPKNAVGNPVLVTFCDASNDAFGACSYFRWELIDGTFESILISSKSRVAPIKIISIVRLELCGAVIGKRLACFIEEEIRYDIKKKYFIVDSQIVRSMIRKESYGFKTFAAVRIGEIQQATDVDDWYWVESKLNVSDFITRGKKPSELGEKSTWQDGPEFMKKKEDEWPIDRSTCGGSLPEECRVVNVSFVVERNTLADKIDIKKYSKFKKLIQVTARVYAVFHSMPKPSFSNILQFPSKEDIERAEQFWIKDAQLLLLEGIEKGDYKRLCPRQTEDGIFVVSGRMENFLAESYNPQELILLPHNHRLARLYSEYIHCLAHLGIAATVSKIRIKFWITKLPRIVKSIRNKCVPCRKLNKKFEEQRMGQLPSHRLKPSPAFHTTFVDLFGPLEIKGVVNKRVRSKCFGVLYTCSSTRAVYCDVSPDYTTGGFLQTTRRFVSIRGYPSDMYSDPGSQLVAADKELRRACKDFDKDKLREFGASNGLKWHFSSADAPWQNGCVESLIKSVKRALKVAIGGQVLSFPELQTVLFEAANLVNERPIGVHNRELEDGNYLCPNDLLLGRASARIPSGPFKMNTSSQQRFTFIQSLVEAFWKKWIRDYFHSLLVRPKWHTQKRNVRVGDVVLIQETSAIRGNWKMGRVAKVFPSESDGSVRNVDIQYKNDIGKKFVTVRRPVQRLVVLLPIEEDNDQLDI